MKLRHITATALTAVIGVGAATLPAQAVDPDCAVSIDIDEHVPAEVQPEATITLTNCGSGVATLQVVAPGETWFTSRDLGTLSDGEHKSFIGANQPGEYLVWAVVDRVDSEKVTTTVADWPTVDHAGWELTGETADAWGSFDTSEPMTVWTEVAIGDRWVRSSTATTDEEGNYSIPLTYGADTPGIYTFRVTGRYPSGLELSTDSFVLERVGRPTAKSAGIEAVGEAANVSGVLDVYFPASVWTEVQVGDRWVRSQTGTTKDDGSYSLPLTYAANTAGTTRWRVGGNIEGEVVYSDEFALRRVQRPSASSAGQKPIGQTTNTWGNVDTDEPVRVWTEAWVGNRWLKSQERMTNEAGGYVIPLTYGVNEVGTYRYRIAAEYPEGIVRSDEFTIERVWN